MTPTHHGELLNVPERMIVSPSVGVFRPNLVGGGDVVNAGDEIGVLEGPGTSVPVRSPFRGMVIGMLAQSGERLREGQPVAWLRSA
jgi:biotin carboxyl carrier protein